jgi:hypothetical protein
MVVCSWRLAVCDLVSAFTVYGKWRPLSIVLVLLLVLVLDRKRLHSRA